ncbi:MAG: hypothetical protein P4M13_06960 [Alphaproteobacteria bacterium]|nr:hypothetical protein [Alphaproteobacteria bacterium]
MTNIIEKPVKVEELPPFLRDNFKPGASVLVSVRELTENDFTKEFEDHILAAEKSGVSEPMESADAIEMLRRIADENNVH